MYIGYYKSPIGILKIICNEESLISLSFEEVEEDSENKNEVIEKVIYQLKEYFEGNRKEFELKLELQGTEFQNKVWQELLNIPYGEVVSYKDIASSIGNEKASRAVGGANNKNKIAIIIPCHRVIGANKSLTGYAGGLNKKKWLIEHEKAYK